MTITQRGRMWYIRQVLARYQVMGRREAVHTSLHPDSKIVCPQGAPVIRQGQLDAREALLTGDSADAERRFATTQKLVRIHAPSYLAAPRLAGLSHGELPKRKEMARARWQS